MGQAIKTEGYTERKSSVKAKLEIIKRGKKENNSKYGQENDQEYETKEKKIEPEKARTDEKNNKNEDE